MIKAYKNDQGRMARMAAFWTMAFLALFGCMFLYDTLTTLSEKMKEPLGGLVIPIVGIVVNPAFLVCALLFVGGFVVLYAWHQKPNVAELLIGTEGELKKVTWPSWSQVVNSSIVVVVCVLVLMFFLAGSDMLLGRVFKRILLG